MDRNNNKQLKWTISVIALIALPVLSSLLSLSAGEMDISLPDAFKFILRKGNKDSIEFMLINQVRLPRIILGIAVGGSLSLAGAILQGIYRNPLVEPYTLGISGGASLGVALAITGGLHTISNFALPVSGFIGAFTVTILVYIIGSQRGKVNINQMLLIGVMISFIASSCMMLLMSISTAENLHGILFWTMGSLDEPNTALVWSTLGIAFAILIISLFFAKALNALRLGEEKALYLGIDTQLAIKVLFILASVLTGLSVSVAGVIGFVGLIIPHLARLIFKNDYRILLIASFFLGGSFLVLSDIAATKIIAPNELPIGVITGIIGGVIFIILMSKKLREEGAG